MLGSVKTGISEDRPLMVLILQSLIDHVVSYASESSILLQFSLCHFIGDGEHAQQH